MNEKRAFFVENIREGVTLAFIVVLALTRERAIGQ